MDQQAFLISLQGLANRKGPRLYFVYPEKWDFRFTPVVLDYYHSSRHYSFTNLRSTRQALAIFKSDVKGYIVWDKEVRTSLIIAFTLAGLEQAVVVSEDQIPLMEAAAIPMIEDFRGRFTGQSDLEIYTWARDAYWDRTAKDCIVWLGGEHGNTMKPGVVDWGMHNRAFFQDLSCRSRTLRSTPWPRNCFPTWNRCPWSMAGIPTRRTTRVNSPP